jgi:hypothetical protein
MSVHEPVDRLIGSFRTSTGLLEQLLEGLMEHRTAWVSARASTLAQPATRLDHLAQALAAEEQQRAEVMAELATTLPLPRPLAGRELKIDVGLLADHLPPKPATQLRLAAAATTQLAKVVRAETALGERLLTFSRQAHEGLVRQLVGATHQVAGTMTGYDRRAHKVHGSMVGSVAPTGSLVDGRM